MNEYLEKVAKFGFDESIELPDENCSSTLASMLSLAHGGLEAIKKIAMQFLNDMNEANASLSLTQNGKAEKVRELAKKAIDAMDAADRQYLAVLEKRKNILETEFGIVSSSSGQQDPCLVIREVEIRAALLKLDSLGRLNVFSEALNRMDPLVFSAFSNSPFFIEILSERVLSEGRLIWAAKKNPELSDEFGQVGNAYRILLDKFCQVYAAIGDRGLLINDTMRSRLQNMAAAGLETARKSRACESSKKAISENDWR